MKMCHKSVWILVICMHKLIFVQSMSIIYAQFCMLNFVNLLYAHAFNNQSPSGRKPWICSLADLKELDCYKSDGNSDTSPQVKNPGLTPASTNSLMFE